MKYLIKIEIIKSKHYMLTTESTCLKMFMACKVPLTQETIILGRMMCPSPKDA